MRWSHMVAASIGRPQLGVKRKEFGTKIEHINLIQNISFRET
jgi:hypothetical protein